MSHELNQAVGDFGRFRFLANLLNVLQICVSITLSRNEPFITVEGELISALLKGGCIDPEDVADPGRVSLYS